MASSSMRKRSCTKTIIYLKYVVNWWRWTRIKSSSWAIFQRENIWLPRNNSEARKFSTRLTSWQVINLVLRSCLLYLRFTLYNDGLHGSPISNEHRRLHCSVCQWHKHGSYYNDSEGRAVGRIVSFLAISDYPCLQKRNLQKPPQPGIRTNSRKSEIRRELASYFWDGGAPSGCLQAHDVLGNSQNAEDKFGWSWPPIVEVSSLAEMSQNPSSSRRATYI